MVEASLESRWRTSGVGTWGGFPKWGVFACVVHPHILKYFIL